MEYNSITETAAKWGISTRRIRTLCAAERIPGAQRVGACWVIPADAVKPGDKRRRGNERDTDARSTHQRRP